jgi:hypothetical protein
MDAPDGRHLRDSLSLYQHGIWGDHQKICKVSSLALVKGTQWRNPWLRCITQVKPEIKRAERMSTVETSLHSPEV